MSTLEQETLIKHFENNNITTPSNKDEDWLYYDLDGLLKENLSKEGKKAPGISIDGHYLYFKDGTLEAQLLPNDVQIKETTINLKETKDSFIQLATHASKNFELTFNGCTSDISIIYDNSHNIQSTALCIHALKSNITIRRLFLCKESESVTNNYIQLNIQYNSTVVINEENRNNQAHIFDFVDASLENNCHLIGLNQSYLSHQSRFQNRAFINGSNATVRLNGLAINDKNNQSFYNTHIYHNVGDTESHQLFKSINKTNALFEYNGKVSVKKDAQLINSYQLNQNIILDEYATIHSRPQLFIDADDVKCSHGSTTGDLNQDELFYLKSRGLDELNSRKLVLKAFSDECFQHPSLLRFKTGIDNILDHII